MRNDSADVLRRVAAGETMLASPSRLRWLRDCPAPYPGAGGRVVANVGGHA